MSSWPPFSGNWPTLSNNADLVCVRVAANLEHILCTQKAHFQDKHELPNASRVRARAGPVPRGSYVRASFSRREDQSAASSAFCNTCFFV